MVAIMTKDEALKMAIEAIDYKGVRDSEPYWEMMNKTIKACKEALEQPAQEPVTLKFPTMLRKMWSGGEVQKWLDNQEPLYTHPAPSWQGLSDDEFEGAGKYFGRAI